MNDERTYDAWGSVRADAQQNDPHGQYCASLGHKADDEIGFIYMRARYYEPSTGRFVSEDLGLNGLNEYSFFRNNPLSPLDYRGTSADQI